jgi:hypothetical protein
MRYLPSDAQDNEELRPGEDHPASPDDAFDVTAHLASSDEVAEEKPYESVTLKILRKFWRLVDPRLNGFGPGLLRLAGISLAAFLPAWGLARYTASLPPLITASLAGGLAAFVALALVLRSRNSDDLTLYSRLHLGLMAAGAMCMAGWLPGHLVVSLIGPMGVGYGTGSFIGIFILAFICPRTRPEPAGEGETSAADEDGDEDAHLSDQTTARATA